jgi:SAM-dependent MidA family methyltransferase
VNLSDLDATGNTTLVEIIRERIRKNGPIPFDEYLRLALYHPLHGYYFCRDPSLDYQSSANLHPIFGAMLARQLADFWRRLGRPARFDVFEAGSGSGRLAIDILAALKAQEPEAYESVRYVIQDVTYANPAHPELAPKERRPAGVRVAHDLPASSAIEGVILSNELLDALPFRRAVKRDGRLRELRVGLRGDRFADVEAEPDAALVEYFAALGVEPGEGCEAEVGLETLDWLRRAASALRRGFLLTLDYGYEAAELYAPWRKRGTLLTFYRHTAGEDPYSRVGRQDITASVNFTSIMRAGESSGLQTLTLTTQADFLAALGIGEALAQPPAASDLEAFYALRRSVLELTDAAGLGRIRVLIQGMDVPETLPRGLAPSS